MSKKLALRLLAKRQTAIFEDRFDLHDIKLTPRFSDFAREYLLTFSKINKAPQSWRRDQISVNNLNIFFGKYRLNEIKPMLIEHYKQHRLGSGRKPATINRELALLKHLYTVAERNDEARTNPAKKVQLLREDNVVQRVLSETDEERLIRSAAPHVRRVVICALDTGMRLGEILSLLWEYVDLQNRVIIVAKTKTRKTREIPIRRRLMTVFEEAQTQATSGHVFRHFNGEPIKSVREGYKNALSRAGLEHRHYLFHDLRHTFATRLAECGVSLFTVKELLGHSTILTTQRYAHPGRRAKQDAIARLDRHGDACP
ncbi:MAG: tyrosine-type recombinase/integrase [Candidatus Latescibacteria bacterium]|nr:tyrosine-type recombinase/integrase [Candidatus Latescibacterota bacterium]NIM64489.1 tyrosine-type recombinase/integrase [Candidatus Latescibacterota bacterium]NIO00642.1 tyrosine-type recombinase/integrase [Candidatus Latescibacterota bacterium]NIO27045.1 tyrosine-type recombinase/integrase [Candidatus Latescibacterota bacterium]NIO54569.1 tyrosine-type recombinase/integrase [Candidatus Latescibacterota bacterium]